jgi:hypothetical protein
VFGAASVLARAEAFRYALSGGHGRDSCLRIILRQRPAEPPLERSQAPGPLSLTA